MKRNGYHGVTRKIPESIKRYGRGGPVVAVVVAVVFVPFPNGVRPTQTVPRATSLTDHETPVSRCRSVRKTDFFGFERAYTVYYFFFFVILFTLYLFCYFFFPVYREPCDSGSMTPSALYLPCNNNVSVLYTRGALNTGTYTNTAGPARVFV